MPNREDQPMTPMEQPERPRQEGNVHISKRNAAREFR